MITLNIITPVTRPDNLLAIHTSLLRAKHNNPDKTRMDLRWLLLPDPRYAKTIPNFDGLNNRVIYTSPEEMLWCEHHAHFDGISRKHYFSAGFLRNKAFQSIHGGWVWFLDDDNICHLDFLWRLFNLIENLEVVDGLRRGSTSAFIFSQLHPGGKILHTASPRNARLYYVDLAQLVIHHCMLKDYNFLDNCNTEDGRLIEQIHHDHPDKFMFVKDPLVYYNYLRPVHDPLWRRLKFYLKRTLHRSLP